MKKLFLSLLLGGMSLYSQGQALIGMSAEEVVEYHRTPAGVTVSQGYKLDEGRDSLIVIEAPFFTTFAFIDTVLHLCTHYTLIVDNIEWQLGYDTFLKENFERWGISGNEWITDDSAVIIEAVGPMKIEWDGTKYVGYVYTTRLR